MLNEQVENVMAIAFELARIREEHGAQSGMYLSEVRALRAEVERLAAQAAPSERDAQDAARYRWLRAEHVNVSPMAAVCWKRNYDRNSSEWVNTASPQSLDSGIDAAMAKD